MLSLNSQWGRKDTSVHVRSAKCGIIARRYTTVGLIGKYLFGFFCHVGCPGRFQVTNAERESNERKTKFGQGFTTGSPADYHLDLIQIFHLRQQVCALHLKDFLRGLTMVYMLECV